MITIGNQSDDDYRVNSSIKADKVRLVKKNGNQIGVTSFKKAKKKADEAGLDLVEVAPKANPVVVKLMDYNKFRYEQQKKAQKAKQNQNQVKLKQLRLKPHIEEHDLKTKCRKARSFLTNKNKVKFDVQLYGRMKTKPEQAENLLRDIKERLIDVGDVAKDITNEGNSVRMTLRPK